MDAPRSDLAMDELGWDERGLIPAIVQDATTREVLMLAYVSRESLRLAVEQGDTWFWSRERRVLWHKGETSGNYQHIREIRIDCDGDALIFLVDAAGPACHTGRTSCFYRTLRDVKAKEHS
jgi:phosphoribosyl-ATP pyrophosphohydrolase/phosphoribosyl-AMP cyclohydrolase